MRRVQSCRVVTFVAVSCVLATGCNRATDNTGESTTGSPTDAKSSSWIDFVPDGGGFHAKFPAKPNYTYQIGPFDAHRFRVTGPERLEYYVGVSNFPPGRSRVRDPKSFLVSAGEKDVYHLHAIETHDISLGDVVGIEEYLGIPRRTFAIVRHYYSNSRVYTVGVKGKSLLGIEADDPLITKFFDSFEIRPGLPAEPGPPTDEEIANWLDVLRSDKPLLQSQAALEIAGRDPKNPPNSAINKALVNLYANGEPFVKLGVMTALRKWAIPANAPALAKNLQKIDDPQGDLLRLLGRLKNPEVIPEILAFAEQKQGEPVLGLVPALSAYGPSIEPRMIKIIQSNEQATAMKRVAIKVLERVGTPAAIPALTNFRDKAVELANAGAAYSVIKAIQQREKQK